MSSTKCLNCGLINFSTDESCKRCKSGLSAPAQLRFAVSHTPPPPPVFNDGQVAAIEPPPEAYPCIRCGSRQGTTVRKFVKGYSTPWAVLGIFIGCLPYVLLKLVLRVRHRLTAPFCNSCWESFLTGRKYEHLNVAFCVVLFVGVLAFAIYLDSVASEWWALGAFFVSIILYEAVNRYLARYGPKFKRLTWKEAVIDAPNVGEIVFTR